MNVGSDNLNREFKGILFKFSKILAPADLLSLISPESGDLFVQFIFNIYLKYVL